jgi:hypothetical protein
MGKDINSVTFSQLTEIPTDSLGPPARHCLQPLEVHQIASVGAASTSWLRGATQSDLGARADVAWVAPL